MYYLDLFIIESTFLFYRALQQDKVTDKKAWICAGKMFLKVDQKKAIQMLSKGNNFNFNTIKH